MDVNRIATRIAQGWQDALEGGLADEKVPQNFDPIALVNGLVVELEHVNKEAHEILKGAHEDVHTALEIAMDHLTEDTEYYAKLADMEGDEFIE